MFQKGRERKQSEVQKLASAVTEMTKAITPQGQSSKEQSGTSSVNTSVGISPGKIANLRSTYLQQLRDLHSLLESGAITENEFQEQKSPILEQLRKFVP